jgi:hypothetical protein
MLKAKVLMIFLAVFGTCGFLYPQDRGTEVVAVGDTDAYSTPFIR